VTIPGKFTHTLQFKIRGKNPDEAVAQTDIRGMTDGVNTAPWYAGPTAREESQLQGITRRYNQFNGLNSSDAKIEGTTSNGREVNGYSTGSILVVDLGDRLTMSTESARRLASIHDLTLEAI